MCCAAWPISAATARTDKAIQSRRGCADGVRLNIAGNSGTSTVECPACDPNAISVSAVSEGEVDEAVTQITDLLRQRHRIRPGSDPDFIIFTQKEISSSAEATSKVSTARAWD